ETLQTTVRPASSIEVNGEGNAVHVAVRAPPDRKRAVGRRLLEGGRRHEFIVFENGGRPRDDAGGKDDARVALAGRAGGRDQRILAGAARSDDQHQPPRTDQFRSGGERAQSCRNPAHMRSVRLPTAISPRSRNPTASAGVLLTMRTAAASSMSATACGRRNA